MVVDAENPATMDDPAGLGSFVTTGQQVLEHDVAPGQTAGVEAREDLALELGPRSPDLGQQPALDRAELVGREHLAKVLARANVELLGLARVASRGAAPNPRLGPFGPDRTLVVMPAIAPLAGLQHGSTQTLGRHRRASLPANHCGARSTSARCPGREDHYKVGGIASSSKACSTSPSRVSPKSASRIPHS